MSDFRPGDIVIEQCSLYSLDGRREVDIRSQVREIHLYESVLSPVLHADVYIQDGIGLYRGFPIIGEEYLELKFKTPTFNSIEVKMMVNRVVDLMPSENNKTLFYTLETTSKEVLTNGSKLVNRRFDGQVSRIVQDIIKDDLQSSKNVFVEETRGIDDHLITNITPFQAIDKLRHRAVSSSSPSSSYVFYETPKGFHFKTLEKLIKEGVDTGNVYDFDDNMDFDISQARFRDIIAFSQPTDQDSAQRIAAGALNNTVRKYDLLTGDIVDVKYDNEQFEDLYARTGSTPRGNSAQFAEEHGKTSSRVFFVPYTSDIKENFIGEKVGILHGFVEKICQNLVHIEIFGDSNISIGDLVACNFTMHTGILDHKEVKTRRGQYIIAKIRHIIVNADRPFYTQSLELISNSLDKT